MIAPIRRALLAAPFIGFLLVLELPALGTLPLYALVAFALILAANAGLVLGGRARWVAAAVLVVIGVLAVVGAASWSDPAALGSWGGAVPIALATWLALPFLSAAFVVAVRSPAAVLLAFEAALVDALLLAVVLTDLASAGQGYSAAVLFGSYGHVVNGQFASWVQLLLGAHEPVFPLQSYYSIAFSLVASLALIAVLLPMLEPPGLAGAAPGPGSTETPPGPKLAPSMEAALARASSPAAPPLGRTPGIVALLVAGAATLGLLATAVFEPNAVVFVLGLGPLVVLAAIFVIARRPRGRTRVPAAAPSSARPTADAVAPP